MLPLISFCHVCTLSLDRNKFTIWYVIAFSTFCLQGKPDFKQNDFYEKFDKTVTPGPEGCVRIGFWIQKSKKKGLFWILFWVLWVLFWALFWVNLLKKVFEAKKSLKKVLKKVNLLRKVLKKVLKKERLLKKVVLKVKLLKKLLKKFTQKKMFLKRTKKRFSWSWLTQKKY